METSGHLRCMCFPAFFHNPLRIIKIFLGCYHLLCTRYSSLLSSSTPSSFFKPTTTAMVQNSYIIIPCFSYVSSFLQFCHRYPYLLNSKLLACMHIAGGTFALYYLITQHSKMRLIPDKQPEDTRVTSFGNDISSSSQSRLGERINKMLQNSFHAKLLLLMATILACSMVIGDGILTLSISGM